MAANALRIRRAAAARVTRVRRTLRASGEQRFQARGQFASAGPRRRFECEHRFKQRFQTMRDMRCFELFDGKRI